MEEPIQGSCTGYFNRWYFEPSKQMCVSFVCGGYREKRNNFLTVDECNKACKIMRAGGIENPNLAPTTSPVIDCIVSDWSPWSGCRVSYGKGYHADKEYLKEN
nr:kappaPI-actitoxin-Avd3a-like [Onthophagus taurus]